MIFMILGIVFTVILTALLVPYFAILFIKYSPIMTNERTYVVECGYTVWITEKKARIISAIIYSQGTCIVLALIFGIIYGYIR